MSAERAIVKDMLLVVYSRGRKNLIHKLIYKNQINIHKLSIPLFIEIMRYSEKKKLNRL